MSHRTPSLAFSMTMRAWHSDQCTQVSIWLQCSGLSRPSHHKHWYYAIAWEGGSHHPSQRAKKYRSLVGICWMVNFYLRFIPATAWIMAPLFEALTGKPKALVWNEPMVKASHDTTKSLANASLLAHPHQYAPISPTTDNSDLAVGAVLQLYT